MGDSWQPILHHTYAGTPGVVFDQSPKRSHGVAVNLDRSAFERSGASEGSGAIRTESGGHVRVPTSADVWGRRRGLRFEVVCRVDDASGGQLIGGNALGLSIRDGDVFAQYGSFGFVAEFSTAGTSISVPTGTWVTVGFTYDGLTELQLTLDGEVATHRARFAPVFPQDGELLIGEVIGADMFGSNAFRGAIDDVKAWRLDPDAVATNFTRRPVDRGTAQCWLEWGTRLREALTRSPECAEQLESKVADAIRGILQDGLLHSDETRDRWTSAVQSYQDHWAKGDVRAIGDVIFDLQVLLKDVELDPGHNPAVVDLMNDKCLQGIVESVGGPIDCDPEFTEMFRNFARLNSDDAS